VALVGLAIAACGTQTSTTSEWSATVPASGALKSIIVFGVNMEAANRRVLEDQVTTRLNEEGVTAKPSYEILPEKTGRVEARAAVQSAGYDGLLVLRLRGVKETQEFVPGNFGGGFWNGYYGGGGWYGGGGYVATDETVKFENTLWDARANGKLLWFSTTSTLNPTSSKDFAAALAKTVVPELEKKGFVPKKP
jgi:hypothetical protein